MTKFFKLLLFRWNSLFFTAVQQQLEHKIHYKIQTHAVNNTVVLAEEVAQTTEVAEVIVIPVTPVLYSFAQKIIAKYHLSYDEITLFGFVAFFWKVKLLNLTWRSSYLFKS